MSTNSAQLAADIAQLHTDAGLMHNVIHGDPNTAVVTNGGTVNSMAKAINSITQFNPRGAWATSTQYAFKDLFTNAGSVYVVLITHISTTISADQAAGKIAIYQGSTSDQITVADTNLTGYLLARSSRVVDSIAALQALSKALYTRAFGTGYYNPGDGGGGQFWYDSSDTTSGAYFTGSIAPITSPAAPSLTSSAGGTLAPTTYYVKITYVTAAGETLASPESSLAVAANNVLGVTSPVAQNGATGYNVYVSTATGTETKQNSTPIAIGTNWTEPTTGLIAGAALPTTGTGGSLLTVSAITNGALAVNQRITAASGVTTTYIAAQTTGTTGSTGTYTVYGSQTAASTTMSGDNGGTLIVAWDGGRWKLQHFHTVTIREFGAKGDGTTDDTNAIQAALNAGLLAVHVPDGTFLVASGILMPTTVGFVLYGNGTSSILKHTGSVACLHWPVNTNNNYVQGVVRDLTFIGTTATANTVDTSYVGGLSLQRLYFQDVPVGLSSIYVNGSSSVYTHDIRVIDLQIYSNTAGNSGITLGPTAADVQVINFIMNGNFVTNYAIDAKANAQSARLSACHLYNTKLNIALLEGSNSGFTFDDCTLDNALQDVAYVQNCSNIVFNNTRFQAIQSTKNGLTLSNCLNTLVTSGQWDGVVGANSCVYETAGSNATTILGGVVSSNGNFTKSFQLSGSVSAVRFVNNNNPLGMLYSFSGATTAPVPQNTTTYLGVNGAQSNVNNTVYLVSQNGAILSAIIQCDATPAAGQSFTFNLQVNGTTVGTGTISNGSFGVTINVAAANQGVSQGNQVSIQAVTSATSGSANFRYFVSFSD